MSKAFLGRGWTFPVKLDAATGRIALSEYEQDIQEAIRLIVSTAPGERQMRPDFGCGIHRLVFDTMNRATLGLFESRVREALVKWEARIEILALDVTIKDAANGQLDILLTYRIRETNNEFNLVFPFYLNEGVA
jgi:phage baseplate assembly protein W